MNNATAYISSASSASVLKAALAALGRDQQCARPYVQAVMMARLTDVKAFCLEATKEDWAALVDVAALDYWLSPMAEAKFGVDRGSFPAKPEKNDTSSNWYAVYNLCRNAASASKARLQKDGYVVTSLRGDQGVKRGAQLPAGDADGSGENGNDGMEKTDGPFTLKKQDPTPVDVVAALRSANMEQRIAAFNFIVMEHAPVAANDSLLQVAAFMAAGVKFRVTVTQEPTATKTPKKAK